MARKPTESEIQNETSRIGGTGGDYFSAQDRLQQKFDKADNFTAALAAVERTAEVATFDNSEPWPIEPNEALIKSEIARGTPRNEAYVKIKSQMVADAKRLAAFAPEAAEEIQKAVTTANRAAEEAEAVIAAQQAAESAIVGQIIKLGEIRKKIATVQSLALSDDDEKNVASAALNYYVLKNESPSAQNSSGWTVFANELAIRAALKEHIADFVKPLEEQAKIRIELIKASAHLNKINLKKLLALLFSERGNDGGAQLSSESNHYSGLI